MKTASFARILIVAVVDELSPITLPSKSLAIVPLPIFISALVLAFK